MAVLDNLLDDCGAALVRAEELLHQARLTARSRVRDPERGIDLAKLDQNQKTAHGYAWMATYVEALRQMLRWAQRLDEAGKLGELERLILQLCYSEYLNQLAGGIAMSQVEVVRPHDLGVDRMEVDKFQTGEAQRLMVAGGSDAVYARIAQLLVEEGGRVGFGDAGLEDDLVMVRDQFQRYAEERVKPAAHAWHLNDDFIPMEIIHELGELGVFGLAVPEEYGGLGMSKVAMCVVTEELSRGYIGVGSLGTRTEIAAELIIHGGTDDQRERILPGIISGEIIPTAVFTEPGTGSDLGSLKTRAVRDGDVYRVTGNKTWITHAARADIMTLLARTDPDEKGYRGLSMFLAEKPRGTDDDPFPAPGMSGGEIPVLGYRGMKEYELGFDGFEVEARNLLGGEEGHGFKQLMATFESARIQTGARAVGVAQNAMELGLKYAMERQQFGRSIVGFPRVANKLAWMAVETMVARQLCWFSAREKDAGRRCDLEAGMAKLLGARVAWANADNALQIHGGNGYAQEYEISRVLCDARILNIFEGAAEIQAQVIARRLLSDTN
jgi:(2S)-methylsuccinyl-CoA dehydrogenase